MAILSPKTSRRASATVEMAMLLPLIMLLSTGLLEYGWMFLKVQQINGVARNGARLAALPEATTGDVVASIEQDLLDAGFADSSYTLTFAPADVTIPDSGDPVTVTIRVRYDSITLTGLRLLPMPAEISAAVTMAKERF